MNSKSITLAGAVVLIIGLFLPIFTVMGAISISLFLPGQGVSIDGIVGMACAILAGILALINQSKWAVIPGLIALGLLGYDYFRMQTELSGGGTTITAEQAAAVAEMASVNFIGWGVMGLGAVLILVGGAMGWKASAPPAA
jgi:hypothetical protein